LVGYLWARSTTLLEEKEVTLTTGDGTSWLLFCNRYQRL
jgi:hypothetical protein